jgi:NAD(P)-dependent dehydrogenase (short-subunit alcohol dehydrogenase family)
MREMSEPSAATSGTVAAEMGPVVVVTGASRGIGKAIAVAFARAGARLALVARDENALDTTAAECRHGVLVIPSDLTIPEQSSSVAARCTTHFGRVDAVVHAAGMASSERFVELSDQAWSELFAIDVDAPMYLTRALLPGMLERESGRVIFIGSIAGLTGLRRITAYCAAKHALVGLTRGLAAEYPASGVTFNCVCPSYVDTASTDRTVADIAARTGRQPEAARSILFSPNGRLVDPEEVAGLCVFLASEAARSINGQAIRLDGGTILS